MTRSKTTTFFFSLITLIGCFDSPPDERRPLRPLIYTEQPNHTAPMIKAREERLLRELQNAATEPQNVEPENMRSLDQLGEAIVKSAANQSFENFESLFADAESIAFDRGISLEEASNFVDHAIGDSADFMQQFSPGPTSERRTRGMLDVLEFETLVGEKGDYTLVVRLKHSSITYAFDIGDVVKTKRGFRLAGSIKTAPELNRLRLLGLHLRPEVLSPATYWFPMTVGNFWRYRLSKRNVTRDLGQFERGLEDSDGATTRTVQVASIDRIDARRLVRLNVFYDDEDATTIVENWLLVPKAIYICDSNCEAQFSDIGALLEWMKLETPILTHPIAPDEKQTNFEAVREEDVIVPMGKFDGTWVLRMNEKIGSFDDTHFYPQEVWFKPGLGIVKRRIERDRRPVEALIEYRLMAD